MSKFDSISEGLLDEIFALTGQKVTADDPVVVAALFYSAILTQAAEKVTEELVAATKVEREACASVGRRAEEIYNRAQVVAKAAVKAESEQTKLGLTAHVNELLDKARQSLHGYQHDRTSQRTLWLAFGAGVVLATVVGATYISRVERENIAMHKDAALGRSIARVIPALDQPTKEKLLKLLEDDGKD